MLLETFLGSDGEFGFDGLKIEEVKELPEAQIPQNPARFEMVDDDVPVTSLRDTYVRVSSAQTISAELRSLVQVQTAEATDVNEPVIEDITPDSHTALTPEIVTLATELQFDPVLITNYVRNTITYAPYYGAKKGAAGCLREQVCNDVDTASLTIALLRASGIPAQYKKEIAVLPIEQLKNFLGVDEARTVFAAFGLNKVPIYPIIDHPEGETLETADFTADTHFALEWVHLQVYLVYDEQMGIVPVGLPLLPDTVTTTEAMRDALLSHPQARDLQWVPVDVVFQPSVRNRNTIAHNSATFDTRDFWNRFLQYSGTLSPVEKYRQELQSATGIDINSVSSSVRETDAIFDTMPPVLPYLTGSGVTGSGVPITMETFSILPGRYDYDVTVSLKHKDGGEVVFAHTFTGIEINNTPFEVRYEGATEGDQAVIESYGGLHATPATLVSIVPSFVGGDFAHIGETVLSIGDELVLGFEYSRDGTSLYTNEKFSIAGNTEGVFITLHGLSTTEAVDDLSNPDRASEILLLGNAAIAREYLRVAFAEADRVADGLDYVYGNVFARAVVTQNRTLSRVEGTPTTFDFSGLSLDASTLITDYSRRNDFRMHRQDFRLLFGLSSSYYEGQFFTDLTSLTGISTVQGLQYAYANPGTYTVHTITSSNESVIDTLALSNNTKANMHTDVAAGNTIITPDKYVEQGAFRGILYISLDPEGTGSYAIGEQVQNGGFTISDFLDFYYFNENSHIIFGFFYNQPVGRYYYEDGGGYESSIQCFVTQMVHNTVVASENWSSSYGHPCFMSEDPKNFGYGKVDHSFILASNGTYFYSPGRYDYWVTKKDVETVLKNDKTRNNSEGIANITLYPTFKFNKAAGTYSQTGHYTGPYEMGMLENCQECLTIYYEPNPTVQNGFKGRGHIVYGRMLIELERMIGILGFPTENRRAAATSGFGTRGKYQNFIGGQIYLNTDTKKTYSVPSKLADYYNARNGTWGKFGFPVAQPYVSSPISGGGITVSQDFEGTRITGDGHAVGGYHITNVTHSPVWYKSVQYGYSINSKHHFLFVDLNSGLENRACFQHFVGQDNSENYQAKDFGKIVGSDAKRLLNGYAPIAAVNGDLYGESGLHGINYRNGVDHSGGSNWTTMGISGDNTVTFFSPVNNASVVAMKESIPNVFKQNVVVAGGPKIISMGEFTKNSCIAMLGVVPCTPLHDQRTIMGRTSQNYLVILVTEDGPFGDLEQIINTFESNYGSVVVANMFDGGGSPSMMFEGLIKRKADPLMSVLMVYSGDACL